MLIKREEGSYYTGEFTYQTSHNLEFFLDRKLYFVIGEKYYISKLTHPGEEYKDWKVITGVFLNTNENECFNYGLSITPYEYEDILNLK